MAVQPARYPQNGAPVMVGYSATNGDFSTMAGRGDAAWVELTLLNNWSPWNTVNEGVNRILRWGPIVFIALNLDRSGVSGNPSVVCMIPDEFLPQYDAFFIPSSPERKNNQKINEYLIIDVSTKELLFYNYNQSETDDFHLQDMYWAET